MWTETWQEWLLFFGTLVVAVGVALVAHYLLGRVVTSLVRRTASGADDLLVRHLYQPVRWIMVAAAVGLLIEPLAVPSGLTSLMTHIFAMALIVLIAWLLIRMVFVLSDVVLLQFG